MKAHVRNVLEDGIKNGMGRLRRSTKSVADKTKKWEHHTPLLPPHRRSRQHANNRRAGARPCGLPISLRINASRWQNVKSDKTDAASFSKLGGKKQKTITQDSTAVATFVTGVLIQRGLHYCSSVSGTTYNRERGAPAAVVNCGGQRATRSREGGGLTAVLVMCYA